MTEAEYNQKIDALITERDALWALFDAAAAAHGAWSREADKALIAASRAEDAVDAVEREYRVEMER